MLGVTLDDVSQTLWWMDGKTVNFTGATGLSDSGYQVRRYG